MNEIVVAPVPSGWTVRHRLVLFERFDDRAAAIRRARRLAVLLRRRGPPPALRLIERSGRPRSLDRRRMD